MSHDRLQQEIFNYIHNNYHEVRKCFWHTPNEFIPDTYIQDQCKAITKGVLPKWLATVFDGYKKSLLIKMGQRKAIGVLAGVTDLVLYWQGILLMMDIKLPGDKLSEAQLAFIAANKKQGGIFIEINTLEQGKAEVDKFFLTHTKI